MKNPKTKILNFFPAQIKNNYKTLELVHFMQQWVMNICLSLKLTSLAELQPIRRREAGKYHSEIQKT